VLGRPIFQEFVVVMFDENDNFMENVGYAGNPWMVSIKTNSGELNGTTVKKFQPADGRAVFDDLVLSGNTDSTIFTFDIIRPYISIMQIETIEPVTSNPIGFIPTQENAVCNTEEGVPFNRVESWSSSCDYVCLSPCVDLGSLSKSERQSLK